MIKNLCLKGMILLNILPVQHHGCYDWEMSWFPGTFSAPNGQGQISKASKVFNFPSLLELLHLPGVNELTRMLANISKQIGNINQITKWVNNKQLHLLHISLKQLAKDPNNNKLP